LKRRIIVDGIEVEAAEAKRIIDEAVKPPVMRGGRQVNSR